MAIARLQATVGGLFNAEAPTAIELLPIWHSLSKYDGHSQPETPDDGGLEAMRRLMRNQEQRTRVRRA